MVRPAVSALSLPAGTQLLGVSRLHVRCVWGLAAADSVIGAIGPVDMVGLISMPLPIQLLPLSQTGGALLMAEAEPLLGELDAVLPAHQNSRVRQPHDKTLVMCGAVCKPI